MTTVVNRHYEEYDVYIGRGSVWGNPYSHKSGTKAAFKTDTVEQAIEGYKHHLWNQIRSGEITISQLVALDGKRLGCYCAPRPCHGYVIQRAVEWAKSQINS